MTDWFYEKWMESMEKDPAESEFSRKYLLGEWTNDSVYSREEIDRMLKRGEISEKRADEMMHMRWRVNAKGEKVVDHERAS